MSKNLHRAAAKVYDKAYKELGKEDIPFYVSLAKEQNAKSILELGCGTGRVTVELAKVGFNTTGIDLSQDMLEVFSEKMEKLPIVVRQKIDIIYGDMSDFSLGKKFDLIITPFRSFQALTTKEQINDCLKCVYEHLNDDGIFVLFTFKPYSQLDETWIYDEKVRFEITDEETGIKVQRADVGKKIDVENQIIYPTIIYYLTYPDGQQEKITEDISLKYYYLNQLEDLVQENGFKIKKEYGWYDKKGIEEGTELILLCSK